MRYLSLFSGIEAASVAWSPLGWEPVAFAEIEPFPCAVLAHHYPHVPNRGDVMKYKEWPDERVELVVGGSPCQAFSIAGLRKGLDDPRGNLTLVYLGVVEQYRPRWVVWENVPGVLSIDGGRVFGAFLGALAELGYGWAYRILDAQYFGVPQRRRRVFVVGHLGDWRRAAQVLFEPHSLSGHPAPRRETGQRVADSLTVGANQCSGRSSDFVETCPAIPASGRGFSRTGESRGQDPLVCGSVSAKWSKGTGGPAGDECYNMVVHSLNAAQRGVTEDGTGRGTPLVAYGFDGGQSGQKKATEQIVENGTGPLIKARPLCVAHPINTLASTGRPDPVNDARMTMGVGDDGDPAFALQSAHSHAVATLSQVRRLTPRECERLQGFPDDYTDIPWRGKEHAPDGPRYKALGNSMAVPVMRWIGERINLVENL